MSECVKETKCTSCIHRAVCMHKSDFLRICEAVDRAKIYEKTENGHLECSFSRYDFFGGIDVKCKYYDAELTKRKGEFNICSNHI